MLSQLDGLREAIRELHAKITESTVDVGARWEPGPFLGLEGALRTEWMGDPFEESIAEHVGADVGLTEWLRLSAGWATTPEDAEALATALVAIVRRAREAA